MKKLFLSFIVLFAGLQVMQAQDLKVKEEGKTEFNSHWFMQLQGGVGHTVGRPGFSDLLTPAAAVNLGYKFNKAFALRFGASGTSITTCKAMLMLCLIYLLFWRVGIQGVE